MNNKGNQKHLTFEQRVDIEKGLTENKSFAEIGRTIGKDSSTISKEVRLHAHTKERPDAGYTNNTTLFITKANYFTSFAMNTWWVCISCIGTFFCMAGNSFGTRGIQKAFSGNPHRWRF